jgi:hypothetical protein
MLARIAKCYILQSLGPRENLLRHSMTVVHNVASRYVLIMSTDNNTSSARELFVPHALDRMLLLLVFYLDRPCHC